MSRLWHVRVLAGLIGAVGVLFGDFEVEAQTTNSWTNSVSGNWEIAANWTTGLPPATNGQSFISITNPTTKTVTIDASTVASNAVNGCLTISNLFVRGLAGTVNTLQLTNAGTLTPLRTVFSSIFPSLSVSNGGAVLVTNSALQVNGNGFLIDGTVTLLADGLITATNIVVGSFAGASGTLTVAGGTNSMKSLTVGNTGATGTVWVTGGQLVGTNVANVIGFAGVGGMTVSNGTALLTSTTIGSLAGSAGTLTAAGGTNQFTSLLTVGSAFAATGAVWVTGGQLVATNATTTIGANGVAWMTVSNGITLLEQMLITSGSPNGRGTLTIAGGTNALTGPLTVGVGSTPGTVWITGGQLVITNTPATVGVGGGFVVDGAMTLNSGSSITVSNVSTVVGNVGSGSLTVFGDSLSVSNLTVANSFGSRGTITFGGGTNRIVGAAAIGLGAASTGTVWVTGGLVNATNNFSFYVGSVGSGNLVVSNGTLRRGSMIIGNSGGSVGTLTVAGGTVDGPAAITVGNIPNSTGTVWVTGGTVVLTNSGFDNVIGNAGVGRMTVSNGLVFARTLNLGSSKVGTLTMAGGTNSVYLGMALGNFTCTATGVVGVTGGRLDVTNNTGTAVLDVRSGSVTLSAGTLTINTLVITNSCGRFFKTGGTLSITTTNLTGSFDADGDGFSNQQEASAGTNPFDPTSAPTVTSWKTASAGKWETDANWSAGAPAAIFQGVFITNATTKTVTVDATTTNTSSTMVVSNLQVSAPAGATNTLLLSGSGTNVPLRVTDTFSLTSGGSLVISNGLLQVEGLGNVFRGDGDILLNALASRLVVTNFGGNTAIGANGPATLTVSNGTTLTRILNIGTGGRGVVTIAGGTVMFDGVSMFLNIASGTGKTGDLWLTSGQLLTTNATVNLGNAGVGRLTVSNGTWLGREVSIGSSSSGQGTLTVVGGTNALTGPLTLGGPGTGTVWVTGGQLVVTNTPATVGAGSGFIVDGSVVVTNGSSIVVINGDTIVGNHGTGSLTGFGFSDLVFSNLLLGATSGATGTVEITGGTLQVQGKLYVGSVTNGTGVLTMKNTTLTWPAIPSRPALNVGRYGSGLMTASNSTLELSSLDVANGSLGTLNMSTSTVSLIDDFFVARPAGSTGTVWIADSQVIGQGSLHVAQSGVGQAVFSNGTTQTEALRVGTFAGASGTLTFAGGTCLIGIPAVNATYAIIGNEYGATGSVWLASGSLSMFGRTYIGQNGSGRLHVSGGVFQGDRLEVGVPVTGSGEGGTLTIAGGTCRVTNLIVGAASCVSSGAVVVAGGSLFVTNAAAAARLDIRSGYVTLSSGALTINNLVMSNACGRFLKTGGTLSITTTNIAGNLDADGDGLPNSWEIGFGFDPFADSSAADPDGDGFTNLQEFQAGTDPTNGASFFGVTAITQVSTNILITWQAGIGKTNDLERSAGAAGSYSNNFTTIFSVTNTTGTTTNYLDTGGATNFPAQYYRIRLVP